MIITEDDKNKVINIAKYLKDCSGSDFELAYWYMDAAIIFYISNGLGHETSRTIAKLMVKELQNILKV